MVFASFLLAGWLESIRLHVAVDLFAMATNAPLLGKEKKGHSKASIFYGADEYLEELKKKCLERMYMIV